MNNVLQFPKGRQRPNNVGVKGSGTIYKVGDCAVRYDGDQLRVSDQAENDREAVACALRTARLQYGRRINVNGSAQFREMIARVAAEERMDVVFSDEALENRRRALLAEQDRRARGARPQLVAEDGQRVAAAPQPALHPGLRDDGNQITVLNNKDEGAVLAMLRLCEQRWGTVKLNGPQEFREFATRIAAKHGIKVSNPAEAAADQPEEQAGFTRKDALILLGVTGAVFGLLFLFFGWSVAVRTTLFIGGVIALCGIGAAFGAQIALGILALLPLAYFLFFAGEGARALIFLLLFIGFLLAGGWMILLAAFLIMGVLSLIGHITGLPLTGPVFQWAAILLAVGGGIYGLWAAGVAAEAARAAKAERYARATPEERVLMDIQDELQKNREVLAQNQKTLKAIRFWQRWG